MLRLTATRLPAAFGGLTRRTLATGPASGGSVSDEMIEKLGSLSTQALIDGLWVMGWPGAHIEGATPRHTTAAGWRAFTPKTVVLIRLTTAVG